MAVTRVGPLGWLRAVALAGQVCHGGAGCLPAPLNSPKAAVGSQGRRVGAPESDCNPEVAAVHADAICPLAYRPPPTAPLVISTPLQLILAAAVGAVVATRLNVAVGRPPPDCWCCPCACACTRSWETAPRRIQHARIIADCGWRQRGAAWRRCGTIGDHLLHAGGRLPDVQARGRAGDHVSQWLSIACHDTMRSAKISTINSLPMSPCAPTFTIRLHLAGQWR